MGKNQDLGSATLVASDIGSDHLMHHCVCTFVTILCPNKQGTVTKVNSVVFFLTSFLD